MPAIGLMAHYLGWEYVFYTMGGLGLTWFILWTALMSDTPGTHPRIAEVSFERLAWNFRNNLGLCFQAERLYIEANVQASNHSVKGQRLPPLWKLATSIPYLTTCFCHMLYSWGFYTLLTGTPLFLNNIHHFSLTSVRLKIASKFNVASLWKLITLFQNGFISTLPYIGMFLASFIVGPTHDILINKGVASKATMRKVCHGIGTIGPGAGLVWLAYVGCNSTMAIVALVTSSTLAAGAYAGFVVRS